VKVDGVFVGCGRHECMLVMHSLCMSVSICHYAYIVMVKGVVHEVIVCSYVIMMLLVCYDANILVQIEQKKPIIKAKLQH